MVAVTSLGHAAAASRERARYLATSRPLLSCAQVRMSPFPICLSLTTSPQALWFFSASRNTTAWCTQPAQQLTATRERESPSPCFGRARDHPPHAAWCSSSSSSSCAPHQLYHHVQQQQQQTSQQSSQAARWRLRRSCKSKAAACGGAQARSWGSAGVCVSWIAWQVYDWQCHQATCWLCMHPSIQQRCQRRFPPASDMPHHTHLCHPCTCHTHHHTHSTPPHITQDLP